MTKDDMTKPVPRDELAPLLEEALEYDRAHSFTIKELHRMVDAHIVRDSPEYHVHEQTVRQVLKEWASRDDSGVYSRVVREGEHPSAGAGSGNAAMLYSLTNPVPEWSSELGDQIIRDFPLSRGVPVSTRGRRKTQELANDTLAQLTEEPDTVAPNARAELICTLVRELVTDSVSVDTLQARDDEIARLKEELTATRAAHKTLERQLKKIRSFLGDGV